MAQKGGTLAHAYAIECLGGLLGGLAGTLLLALGISNLAVTIFCALIGFSAALPGIFKGKYRTTRASICLMLGILGGIGLAKTGQIDMLTLHWTRPRAVAMQDTPYSRVVVSRRDNQISVFENDVLSFETQGTWAEQLVHLPLIQHPNPERVLVIGGGMAGLIRELLKYPLKHVDYLVIDRHMLSLVTPFLPMDDQKALAHPKLSIHFEDPRSFLHSCDPYDVILVGMPEPASGRMNRFYTHEFFSLCHQHLTSSGLLAFNLRSAENIWTPPQIRKNSAVYRALIAVFADAMVLPGATNVFIGCKLPLSRDPDLLVKRFESRDIETRLISPPLIRYLFQNDRFFEIADILTTADSPMNMDARPICYLYAAMIWLGKFFPGLVYLDPETIMTSHRYLYWYFGAGMAGLLLLVWIARKRIITRQILIAGVAGFSGIVLETLLILNYQTQNGSLYQNIGVLLTLYMLGMTLGAAGVHHLAQSGDIERRQGILGAVLLSLFCLLVGVAAGTATFSGLLTTLFLLWIAGFLTAMMFAYASFMTAVSSPPAISSLYGADLIGGCLGSLLVSLVLIPVAGLMWTALGLGIMVLLLFALI